MCVYVFSMCAHILCVHIVWACVFTRVCVCIQTFPVWLVCHGCPCCLVVGDKAVAEELARLPFGSTARFTVDFHYAASSNERVYGFVS